MKKPAVKIGGSYQAEGFVVAEFTTTAGERRVVFEFTVIPGMLHIFNLNQIHYTTCTSPTDKPAASAAITS
jgi:hypothetical protein